MGLGLHAYWQIVREGVLMIVAVCVGQQRPRRLAFGCRHRTNSDGRGKSAKPADEVWTRSAAAGLWRHVAGRGRRSQGLLGASAVRIE